MDKTGWVILAAVVLIGALATACIWSWLFVGRKADEESERWLG